mgnify:CR=1 FL=1
MIRTFLKAYFWFVCLLIIVFTFFYSGDDEPYGLFDYLDWVFTLITLSGVFAYCYLKRWLTAKFWRTYLPVLIGWDVFFVSKTFIEDPIVLSEELGLVVFIIWLLFVVCLLLPSYIALYLLPKEFETNDDFEMEA